MDLAQSTTVTPQKMVTPNFGQIPEAINQVLNIQKNRVGLEQAQQSLLANKAVSEHMANSINPQTGELDQPKLMSLIAQDPRTAYNLPTIANQVNQATQSAEAAKQAKMETNIKGINYWHDRLAGLRLTKNLDHNHIVDSLAKGVEDGFITIQQAQRELQDLPKDTKQLNSWVDEHYTKTSNAKDLIDLYVPTEEIIDPATNKKIKVPKAQLLGMQGGQGNMQSNINPSAPVVGFSPSEQTALTTTGTNQANAAQELHSSVASAPTRINILESARQNLENPDLSTGPGVEGRNQIKSFFAALSPELTEKIFGKDFTGVIKDQEEFKKYMTQYSNFVSAGLGSGTDARLNASLTGNPNPNILKMSNQDLLTKTIAIEKMNKAQDYAWQNSGISPDKFNQWQSQWNKQVKPEVFAFTSMTPIQQKDFIERKNKDGSLGMFKKDLTNMVKQGFLESPGQ
jgi:hypothetical protein